MTSITQLISFGVARKRYARAQRGPRLESGTRREAGARRRADFRPDPLAFAADQRHARGSHSSRLRSRPAGPPHDVSPADMKCDW
jgi:hypothetical protein